jgi:GAF domain
LGRLKDIAGSLPRELMTTIVATIVAVVVVPLIVSLLTKDQVHAWAVALAAVVGLLVGLLVGAALGGSSEGEGLKSRIDELESRTGELGGYETYVEHVRDALSELRKVVTKELPSMSTRDFIEIGIFEPADKLLERDHRDAARGDVRFSILVPDGDDFVMADASGLQPAHGHRVESRQSFRLPINASFAGVAFHTGQVQSSNHLSSDQRFKRHPKATTGREYQSMVSVPLWRSGEVDGVLNVLAVRKDAFSTVDRTYITLLASVIDVARSVDAAG